MNENSFRRVVKTFLIESYNEFFDDLPYDEDEDDFELESEKFRSELSGEYEYKNPGADFVNGAWWIHGVKPFSNGSIWLTEGDYDDWILFAVYDKDYDDADTFDFDAAIESGDLSEEDIVYLDQGDRVDIDIATFLNPDDVRAALAKIKVGDFE
jgi:hypothetical protein